MALLRTSVLTTNPLSSDTVAAPAANQQKGQSFVTVQSLASFSGFTALITILWKLADQLGAHSKIVPLAACLVIGLLLWWDSITGVPERPRPSQLALGLMVTIANAGAVYLAVIGADATLDQTGIVDITNTDVEVP